MELTGLQIFKYLPAAHKLPQSNCKECNCPTCMSFALKLAKKQSDINSCPYIPEELRKIYEQNLKNPQKVIKIGNLEIGGENVLYRHEKTFINPTVFAVIIDCAKPDFKQKLDKINSFGVNILGETKNVDLVILKNSDKIEIPEILTQWIFYEDFTKLELDFIREENFVKTKNYLIETRTKAIKEKNESNPVCVFMKNDSINSQCARSGFYTCKYANILVFEEFSQELFSSLLLLRQNIYTDPQRTLQVESGLYKFNEPDKNSIIFLTTNFALTFFAVSNELENLPIPSYLIVIPAQGMSVLTAWSAQTFNPEVVAETIKNLKICENINTRKIILPGLLGNITDELQSACPDFEFVEGAREACAIGKFITEKSSIILGC